MARMLSYQLDQSPLYRLKSKRKLAALLEVPLKDLLFLLGLENYRNWVKAQKPSEVLAGLKPSKERWIQQPRPLVRALHKRLAAFLGRIQKPDFVYSATKGRSYVDNAKQHKDGKRAVKVDVKSFYPSVKQKAVREFFARDLQCSPDVAHLLSRICCADGFLPTGSAVSPVLSYFACSPLFLRIAELATAHGLVFTLYVDDMVFSGDGATREFSRRVVRELARCGFVGHKISYFPPAKPKIITGVAVWSDAIGIPYKRQMRIRAFEEAFRKTTIAADAKILGATLLGQYREAERLQSGSRSRATPVQQRLDGLPQYVSVVTRS